MKPKFLSPEPKRVKPVPSMSSSHSFSRASRAPPRNPVVMLIISDVSNGSRPSSQPGIDIMDGILSATHSPAPLVTMVCKSSRSLKVSSRKSQKSFSHCFLETREPKSSHLNSLNFIICSGEEQIEGFAGVPSSNPPALLE